jgi:hypothetical protein
VHVPIDKTRQYQVVTTENRFRSGRWRPLPYGGDGFAAHCDICFPNNGVSGDDSSGDHAVEWS